MRVFEPGGVGGSGRRAPAWHALEGLLSHPGGVALVGAILLLPLALNPGWFSHDELQWAAFARPLDGVPAAAGWLEIGRFQYRPLTFELWLALASWLAESPRLHHAVHAALGLAVALALRGTLVAWRVPSATAGLAALLFLAHPYAVFVHAWVATLADLIWVGAGIAIARVMAPSRSGAAPGVLRVLAVAPLVALALLAKEAAVVLPALLVVLAMLTRERAHLVAAFVAALPVAAYLALRLPVILSAPADPIYGWSLAAVPGRALGYVAFPYALALPEIVLLARLPTIAWLALGAIAALHLALVARVSRRAAFGWLAGGLVAVAPVLILSSASNQYGYGFAAIAAAATAVAITGARGRIRGALLALAAAVALHGALVGWHVVDAGVRASRFVPALAEALRDWPGPDPLRLSIDGAGRAWLWTRLTHEVPHVGGVPVGDRVVIVGPGDAADLRVRRDGRLEPFGVAAPR
jgi:hypothetical protein